MVGCLSQRIYNFPNFTTLPGAPTGPASDPIASAMAGAYDWIYSTGRTRFLVFLDRHSPHSSTQSPSGDRKTRRSGGNTDFHAERAASSPVLLEKKSLSSPLRKFSPTFRPRLKILSRFSTSSFWTAQVRSRLFEAQSAEASFRKKAQVRPGRLQSVGKRSVSHSLPIPLVRRIEEYTKSYVQIPAAATATRHPRKCPSLARNK